MTEKPEGCVVPAKGPVNSPKESGKQENIGKKEEIKSMVTAGKVAPDFEATAYHEGTFKNVKLSDYKGKWVVLCFYPGDFTFV